MEQSNDWDVTFSLYRMYLSKYSSVHLFYDYMILNVFRKMGFYLKRFTSHGFYCECNSVNNFEREEKPSKVGV